MNNDGAPYDISRHEPFGIKGIDGKPVVSKQRKEVSGMERVRRIRRVVMFSDVSKRILSITGTGIPLVDMYGIDPDGRIRQSLYFGCYQCPVSRRIKADGAANLAVLSVSLYYRTGGGYRIKRGTRKLRRYGRISIHNNHPFMYRLRKLVFWISILLFMEISTIL
jgi:hypothetical protein